ncbi:MAG: YgiQ family radical SAM protein [Clostridia bacterium]|nr:YgiQ family radical SAM protein [Clostridia bacterium]
MFLPVSKKEVTGELDFVMISSDAYVDHSTYGHAIISRLIESEGFSIGIIPQPITDEEYFALPQPKIAYLISGGVVDSMVNNYTVAKKKREGDVYSPLPKQGKRPDRQVTVYANTLKRLFPDSYVIIGGVEPSLRRFAHYDYWADTVMQSQLIDSRADLLIYGAGEKPFWDILALVKKGVPINKITDVRGTVYRVDKSQRDSLLSKGYLELPSYSAVCSDKMEYAKAFREQSRNTDAFNASVLFQEQKNGEIVVQNLPQFPLSEKEMDFIYNLPFERRWHPMYDKEGGIKSIEEVKFSVVSHRGCYGSCSFCSINYHQGRVIQKRSDESILSEIELLTKDKDFKGYIHDLSGPSANFREPACDKQKCKGVCKDRYCIGNKPCPNLKVDHSGFINLLRKARKISGVKKVFIRSGIRYDYLLYEKDLSVMEELVKHHISGQLKVAPEHMADNVLKVMNKPSFSVYKEFSERYKRINEKLGKKQFLVPYLISSHPGCTIKDAVELTKYLKSVNYMPEQVQDFYPTPSTRSTCMYYTGIDPDTLKPVFVPKERAEKQMQRALLQYRLPKNKDLVNKAYALCSVETLSDKKPKAKQGTAKPAKKFIRGTEVYKKGLSSGKNGAKKKR